MLTFHGKIHTRGGRLHATNLNVLKSLFNDIKLADATTAVRHVATEAKKTFKL
jgi:hypothetical protein